MKIKYNKEIEEINNLEINLKNYSNEYNNLIFKEDEIKLKINYIQKEIKNNKNNELEAEVFIIYYQYHKLNIKLNMINDNYSKIKINIDIIIKQINQVENLLNNDKIKYESLQKELNKMNKDYEYIQMNIKNIEQELQLKLNNMIDSENYLYVLQLLKKYIDKVIQISNIQNKHISINDSLINSFIKEVKDNITQTDLILDDFECQTDFDLDNIISANNSIDIFEDFTLY